MAHYLKGIYRLIKYDIYSGLTYSDIFFKFIDEDIILEPSEVDKTDNEKQKIILFLDEINTTNSLNSLNLLCNILLSIVFLDIP